MKGSLLDRVRVVLHQTQDLVNVAAVVRAMKNMGVSDLWLVDAVPLDRWRVTGIAHGAEDILDRVRQCESLVESLHDCVMVAAFTARRRAAKWRVVGPREAAAELLARAPEGPVALLFGREDRGLPNEALDLANLHVTIPTTEYASLNLAQAVMVALYELHVVAGDATRALAPPRKAAPPPDFEAVQQFYRDLELALESVDFFKTRNREHIVRSLRALTVRASPDARELSLLRAIAIEIRKKLERQATQASHAPSLDLPSSGK